MASNEKIESKCCGGQIQVSITIILPPRNEEETPGPTVDSIHRDSV